MDERIHQERQERHDELAAVATGASAVSWGAVIAGAVAAAAVSLLLFALAAGLDLAALSPERGTALTSITAWTAVALIVIQWLSACLGGYLTGRLRTRWVGTHTHEVFFRDTAHGFLTWCVATLFMASGLVSAGSAVAGAHGARVSLAAHRPALTAESLSAPAELSARGESGAGGAVDAQRAVAGELLLRLTPADSPANPVPDRAVADRAAAAASAEGRLLVPDEPAEVRDAIYLARLVPTAVAAPVRQGVAWEGGDVERKDAAAISIFTALSMLVGAFIASVSAALGGRLRDLHP